jgi:hypothetical protein
MDVRQARSANLLRLLGRYPTLRAFADATGIATPHASQMKGGVRQMGDEVARRIEVKLNLPHGWMDQGHAEAGTAEVPAATPEPPTSDLPVAALLASLAARMERIDPRMREVVGGLILRYLESPETGGKIAVAVEHLLSDGNTT